MSGAVALAALLVVAAPAPRERGVALGLFSAEDDFDYAPLLREIRALGATHVALAYTLWQPDVSATSIRAIPGWTPTEAQILGSARAARALGLHVTVFPILRLEKAEKGQWRGTIAPRDPDAWWRSYTEVVLDAAALARRAGAERLLIGSELVSLEGERARWLELISRVRTRAPELELLYSANWDHFRPVSFWDAVDVVGVTGYFELTRDPGASVEALVAGWGPVIAELRAFSEVLGRRILISELGYPSVEGGVRWPWNSTLAGPVDLEGQRRAYAAFAHALAGQGFLDGLYVWNWFGDGGPRSTDYTPRDKPAGEVLARWYGGAASRTREP